MSHSMTHMELIPNARKFPWQQFCFGGGYLDPPLVGRIITVDKMADVASFRCWVRYYFQSYLAGGFGKNISNLHIIVIEFKSV